MDINEVEHDEYFTNCKVFNEEALGYLEAIGWAQVKTKNKQGEGIYSYHNFKTGEKLCTELTQQEIIKTMVQKYLLTKKKKEKTNNLEFNCETLDQDHDDAVNSNQPNCDKMVNIITEPEISSGFAIEKAALTMIEDHSEQEFRMDGIPISSDDTTSSKCEVDYGKLSLNENDREELEEELNRVLQCNITDETKVLKLWNILYHSSKSSMKWKYSLVKKDLESTWTYKSILFPQQTFKDTFESKLDMSQLILENIKLDDGCRIKILQFVDDCIGALALTSAIKKSRNSKRVISTYEMISSGKQWATSKKQKQLLDTSLLGDSPTVTSSTLLNNTCETSSNNLDTTFSFNDDDTFSARVNAGMEYNISYDISSQQLVNNYENEVTKVLLQDFGFEKTDSDGILHSRLNITLRWNRCLVSIMNELSPLKRYVIDVINANNSNKSSSPSIPFMTPLSAIGFMNALRKIKT